MSRSGATKVSAHASQGESSLLSFGAEASASERKHAAKVLQSYLAARAKGDWSTACSYLASPARRQVIALTGSSARNSQGCRPALAALYGGSRAPTGADPHVHLVVLRAKGKRATALLRDPRGDGFAMPMAVDGGSWKLSAFSPIPYPPAASL